MVFAGGPTKVVVLGSMLLVENGRRDEVEEMSEAVDCLNRGVIAVAEALEIRATAEGEAGPPDCERSVRATKMPRRSSKTLTGRLSPIMVVGLD